MPFELSHRAVLAGAGAALLTPRLLPLAQARAQDAAGPMLLAYPRKVGELEIVAISDGHFAFPGRSSSTSRPSRSRRR